MGGKKLIMLTAYDYPTAKILDEIGIDFILVGDSLGMVILGYPDTKSVTLADMIHHVGAVSRGVKRTPIIADMPINTYNTTEAAIENAHKLIDSGADGVKIEGRNEKIITALLDEKIPVVGHLGLLPQTAASYRVQGQDAETAGKIYAEAKALDELGMTALILECIPQELARKITQAVQTPTIGIGAGKYCDGQVLVLHDVIGLSDFQGKFIRQYANIKENIREAGMAFKQDVLTGDFPGENEIFV